MAAFDNRPCMRHFVQCEEDVPILRDDEQINYTAGDIEVSFSAEVAEVQGKARLYLTNSRLILIGDKFAYDFDIRFILLFAVSRDPNSYPKPCLYCQLDQSEEDGADELFLAPEDEASLKTMFDEFSHAAELNPDPAEDGDDEWVGEDDLIYNVDEVQLGAEQARALAHLDSVFVAPEDQFEDQPYDDENGTTLEDMECEGAGKSHGVDGQGGVLDDDATNAKDAL